MTYSGLLPSNQAIQQAVREPLSGAPRDHKGFAVYIFERARQIDHGRALLTSCGEATRSRTTTDHSTELRIASVVHGNNVGFAFHRNSIT
jgi:hypothetical protein